MSRRLTSFAHVSRLASRVKLRNGIAITTYTCKREMNGTIDFHLYSS